jgi:hypothetical protein
VIEEAFGSRINQRLGLALRWKGAAPTARAGSTQRSLDFPIDSCRLASISSLPCTSSQFEHRAANTACNALAECGQDTEPTPLGFPNCIAVRSLHVFKSLQSERHGRRRRRSTRVRLPSHRVSALGCMASGRLANGRVARIVIADQANCPGSELSIDTHPLVAVRRSL